MQVLILVKLKFRVLVFVKIEEEKQENPLKSPWSKARINNKLNPHVAPSRNRTQATLVGGKRPLHCVIPASPSFL